MTLIRPQRLANTAPPGTLQKRLIGLNVRAKLQDIADSDPAYQRLIRMMPCLHCGLEPCGEAAHLRMASGAHGKASGMGKKPIAKWCLPLCSEHHRLAQRAQHQIGERQFWAELGIDPFHTAELLYDRRGDYAAMRAIVLIVIAERG